LLKLFSLNTFRSVEVLAIPWFLVFVKTVRHVPHVVELKAHEAKLRRFECVKLALFVLEVLCVPDFSCVGQNLCVLEQIGFVAHHFRIADQIIQPFFGSQFAVKRSGVSYDALAARSHNLLDRHYDRASGRRRTLSLGSLPRLCVSSRSHIIGLLLAAGLKK
jgi:hypothetical protein